MLTKLFILFLAVECLTVSCSPRNISTKYYYENSIALDKIEETYKELYLLQPFNIAFTDRHFKTIAVEIITDTLSYIYAFDVIEPRLYDTLVKYHLNAPKVLELIQQIQSVQCIWINNYNYYEDEEVNSLIFMSIKPRALRSPFSNKKYYILTYFEQPQYFDSYGRLLDKKQLRRVREINGEIFKRINNKVCYTVSGKFR